MALLEVRGLRAGYEGIPVVFGVDLEVAEGEVVALLGANGAGKTTTLRAISGVIPTMGGSVTFAGRPITNRPAEQIARAGLLHVPAGRGIFRSLAVAETLRLAGAMGGLTRDETQRRLDLVYEAFPRLGERANQTAGTLSGGEQQMLALARGLIIQPRLLMIDEMSQGLAPTIVMELFRILERFTERGVAVLLVEQFVGQALALASRAYVLEKGEVGYAGPAKKLAADEEFVKGSYLGEVQLEPIEPVAAGDGAAGTSRGRAVLAEHVTVALPPVLIRALQERAGREGRQLSELVQEAVEGVAHDGRGPSDRTPRTQETSRRTANKASTRRSGKGGGRGR